MEGKRLRRSINESIKVWNSTSINGKYWKSSKREFYWFSWTDSHKTDYLDDSTRAERRTNYIQVFFHDGENPLKGMSLTLSSPASSFASIWGDESTLKGGMAL